MSLVIYSTGGWGGALLIPGDHRDAKYNIAYHDSKLNIPEQFPSLHPPVIIDGPRDSQDPYGPKQVLERFLLPGPHGSEQLPHSPHGPYAISSQSVPLPKNP